MVKLNKLDREMKPIEKENRKKYIILIKSLYEKLVLLVINIKKLQRNQILLVEPNSQK